MSDIKRRKSKYAWLISSAGFASQMIVSFSLGIFGISLPYISEDLGISIASLAIASSVFGLGFSGCGVLWGTLVDKIGHRKVMGFGAIMAACSMILFGLTVSSVPGAVIICGLLGIAASSASTGVIPKLVSNWYDVSMRGKGNAVITLGGTCGGALIGVLAPILITGYTWRGCFIRFGVMCLILAVFIVIVLRDSPEKIGTVPLGSSPDVQVGEVEEVERRQRIATGQSRIEAMKRVVKMPVFWKCAIMYLFWSFYLICDGTYLISAITSMGYSLVVAGFCGTIKTIAMLFGTLLWPSIADHTSRKNILGLLYGVSGILYITLFFILGVGNITLLFIEIAFLGFFLSHTPIYQVAISESFPPDLRGTGPGMIVTLSVIGTFSGPIVVSALINAFGGNISMYCLFSGLCLLVSSLIAFACIPKTGGRYGDPFLEQAKQGVKGTMQN